MQQNSALSVPRKGETAFFWFIKMVTGPVLVILLFVHMIVNHLVAENGLMTYNDVINYFSNPLVVAMEIIFLITVITHSLLGLRSIILDLNPSRNLVQWINVVFSIAGVGFIGYGVWLSLTIASRIGS